MRHCRKIVVLSQDCDNVFETTTLLCVPSYYMYSQQSIYKFCQYKGYYDSVCRTGLEDVSGSCGWLQVQTLPDKEAQRRGNR